MGNFGSSCLECFEKPDYIVAIKTGDTKGAGLHNSADIILINEQGDESRKIQLSGCCVTVFKKGRTDNFKVKNLPDFGAITRIIIEQYKEQNDVEWYIDKITIVQVHVDTKTEAVFPVNRWLRMNRPLTISKYDSCLPQHETNIKQREGELDMKRIIYGYCKASNGLPPQMKHIPRDEVFSNFYKWDVRQKRTSLFSIYHIPDYEKPESWKSLEELEGLFSDKGKFRRPKALDEDWQSDLHFGQQRLRGCNPRCLKLCESIPENLAVTDEMVKESLEGFSLNEAIAENKIFFVNHSILDGILDSDSHNVIPSPIALFYMKKTNNLIPIAIQLYQQANKDKPIFLPSDPHYTWLLAKMWFNNADAIFQRVCLLFTSSHWVLEAITLSIHRRLSPSHPIFRLLAPYIRLILAINHFEMHPLITSGGWVDGNMPIKSEGLLNLIKKYWTQYEFEQHCCLEKEMTENKVLATDVIKDYPYRDDGLLIQTAIAEYMKEVVHIYYETDEDVQADVEIQAWAAELVSMDSCNLEGVPGNGRFTCRSELMKVLTGITYKATVEHAALNLPLYDEGAFIPNYPLVMRGEPPKTKDPLTEEDVMAALPTKHVTMEIIILNKTVSERDSSGLADSRAQYQYDEASKAARERFRQRLEDIANRINKRNIRGRAFYDYLNPASAKTHIIL